MNRTAEPILYKTTAGSKGNAKNKLAVVVGVAAALGSGLPSQAVPPSRLLKAPIPAMDQAEIAVARSEETALAELRRLSGLTFDQLARLFQTSRRAIHFWASGKPIAAANQEHLHRLLEVVRRMDRGSSSQNREALLSSSGNSPIPFDLLIDRNYAEAAAILGASTTRRRPALPPLDKVGRLTFEPTPPEFLMGALQENVHLEVGRSRGVKAARYRPSDVESKERS